MELTAQNVEDTLKKCLFKDGEPTDDRVEARGVVGGYGFHPQRLVEHSAPIGEMLAQLPQTFHEGTGGGWSFLNACMREDGRQWGEHRDIDSLLCLGIATGQAKILLPREMWSIFPGGMPYFSVKIESAVDDVVPVLVERT